jgi:hypothetical protein
MPVYYHGLPALAVVIIIVAVAANVGLAFIPAYLAKNKGYSFGAFWCIGFFASFVIGLIIAVCLPDKMQSGYAPYGQPYPPYGQPYGQPNQQQGQYTSYCSKCGHGLVSGDPFCPGCGAKVQ